MFQLENDHVVKFYEIYRSKKNICLIMEYCQNGTLEQLMNNSDLDEYNKDRLILQLCEAIEQISSEGYIHRDLKPENIFLTDRGKVKIGDFGLARVQGSEMKSATYAGSRDQMAPEILRDLDEP